MWRRLRCGRLGPLSLAFTQGSSICAHAEQRALAARARARSRARPPPPLPEGRQAARGQRALRVGAQGGGEGAQRAGASTVWRGVGRGGSAPFESEHKVGAPVWKGLVSGSEGASRQRRARGRALGGARGVQGRRCRPWPPFSDPPCNSPFPSSWPRSTRTARPPPPARRRSCTSRARPTACCPCAAGS